MPSMPLDPFLNEGTLFAKGDRLLIGYGKRSWHSNPISSSQPIWYFPDFFLEDKTPWFTHKHWECISLHELKQRYQLVSSPPLVWHKPYEFQFKNSFQELQTAFQSGYLTKAVPYLFESCTYRMTPSLLKSMLSSILNYSKNSAFQPYGFWNAKEGMLGATPELLFECNEQTLSSMACAGTLYKDQNPDAFLEKKLLKEHQIVITDLQEKLSPYGKIEMGITNWQPFNALRHLVTPLHLQLIKRPNFEQLIKALHPTAALGAYPKVNGKEWLKNYNNLIPRKRFGAPFGCIFQNEAIFRVAIRNVQWDENQLSIGAGVGVIQESSFKEEEKEILAKLNSIKESLSLL